MLINVSVAIVLSMTVMPAMFALVAPLQGIGRWQKRALVPFVLVFFVVLFTIIIVILAAQGMHIKDGDGENLA